MKLRLIAVALMLAGLLAGSVGAMTASGDTWAATATQGISLHNATNLGQDTSSTPIQISVALALRNQSALHSYVTAVTTPGNAVYGQSLTPAEFDAQYGPTNSQADAVEQYLSSQGFQDLSASSNNVYVTGWATPAQAAAAFNTEIDSFSQNGSTVFANINPASVPASLSGTVVSVLGLTNALKLQIPHDTPVPSAGTPSTNVPNSFWAPGFQQAYDATGTAPASNTSIAIMAEGDVSQVVTDLRSYENDSHNNLPEVPVTVEQVGLPSTDTSGLVEFDMDTQTSTGLAGDVKNLYIYDASDLTDQSVALEFNTWATQDLAKAASASFGECEYAAYLDGFMVADDESLIEAAAQGQTLFASAGDSGGFCAVNGLTNGVPGGEPDVNYPASSPWVTAAGGTTLVTNTDGSYGEDLAWVAGGGGVSYFEYQPPWQSGVAPPTGSTCVAQSPACLGRDVPDVAMDADFLLAAANFYNAGTLTSNGGTSLASPLSLGAWARIESATDNAIGFASPSLYAVAGSDGFHDVTLGDTGPYPALPGWDFATGNGSFDIANMIKVIGQTTTTTLPPAVPLPACNLAYGDGAAAPLGSTSNNDALSIQSVGISSNRTNKTLTAELRVKSLNDGPGGLPEIAGTGDQWYVEFTWQPPGVNSDGTPKYQPTTYFLSAAYDGSTAAQTQDPTGFEFGHGYLSTLATGGTNFNPDSDTTVTGSVDFTNGVISITAPWSDFGSDLSTPVPTPTLDGALSHTGAASYEEVGTNATGGLLESGDSASGATPYLVGHNCNPVTLTLNAASLSQTYSGQPAAVAATTSPAGLAYTMTYDGSSTAPTAPGSYDVAASISDYDYTGSANGTLTVAPAPLSVTAGSGSIIFGQKIPSISPSYSGFVNGDTAASLTTALTCSAAATSTSPAGAYATSCQGGSADDYSLSYTPGKLAVALARPSLVYTGPSKAKHGSKVTLSAKLISTVTHEPIASRTVAFSLGKQTCGAKTNSSGVAACAISKLEASKGSRSVAVSFAGDPKGTSYDYSAASTTTTIKVA